MTDRIAEELRQLQEGGQRATLCTATDGRSFVVFADVPVGGTRDGLPQTADVIVPVPPSYPAAMIDLAGLHSTSPLLQHVKGGQNSQGAVTAAGINWQLCSYHPHSNGGGPPWNPSNHGFHTYFDHILSWLGDLT